jgi:DNA-binding transcriptional regulator YiaG
LFGGNVTRKRPPGNLKPAKGKLGKVVRAARERLDMTQAALAQALGIETCTVSNWERGATLPATSRLAQLRMLVSEKEGRLVRPLV